MLPDLTADTPPAVDPAAITIQQRLTTDEAILEARDHLFDTLTVEQAELFGQ